MMSHFLFFVADWIAWLGIGFVMGLKSYPYNAKRKRYKKVIFASLIALVSFLSGIVLSATRGIPEEGFYLYSFFNSSIFSLLAIWITSATFRITFSRKINSIYKNMLKIKTNIEYPSLTHLKI